ncbi:MAG: Cof-type HAD-IIB family hydrolase [Eubacteriales bacterium]|nr:Cof-type HAD-IIB family hydrolase [Eubacteriales bacterium]
MDAIRLIAMDMDGTLLNVEQRITPENLNALEQAAARGVRIAICSGRTARDVSYFASDAGLDGCAVLALNGACCLEVPHAEPYALHTFREDVAKRVTAILLGHGVTFACFQADRVIVLENDPCVTRANWGTYVNRDKPEAYAYGEAALRRYEGEGICKCVYIDAPNAQRIARIARELSDIPGLTVTSSWSDNLELMPAGVGKGSALAELAQGLAIPRQQVMAIGDFDNDLDMIQYAGLGVAMQNGSQRVKEAADYVTLSNAENGVAAAIRRFVLDACITTLK